MLTDWCWNAAAPPQGHVTSDQLGTLSAGQAAAVGEAFAEEMARRIQAFEDERDRDGGSAALRWELPRDKPGKVWAVLAALRHAGGTSVVARFLDGSVPCLNAAGIRARLELDIEPWNLDGRGTAPDVRIADADAICQHLLPSASPWVLDKRPLRINAIVHWSRSRIASAWAVLPRVVLPVAVRLTNALTRTGSAWSDAIGNEVHLEALRHLDRTLPQV
ncbi:MAG: hypothetical protein H0W08_21005, partial [Acidobacteria bacterium]|nr:hypothetical protein [Acidobacteriota bacterium]